MMRGRSGGSVSRERVQEWETDDSGEVLVWFRPATQHELDLVNKEIPDGASGSRWNAQLVVLKALDGEGRRAFVNADADRLLRKGFSLVVNRLARLMMEVPSAEDAEKN
jgi:hypothetical protein